MINNNGGVIASDMFDIANQSSYTSDTKIDVALDVQPKDFTILSLKLSAQPYGQPNAKYVHFCACTRYLLCT